MTTLARPDPVLSRIAGGAYLAIIALGVTSEAVLRAPFRGIDGETLVTALTGSGQMLRLSIAADALMLVADVILAVLMWRLLSPAGAVPAAIATAFRLLQAAIIGASLPALSGALTFAAMPGLDGAGALAFAALDRHGFGYDLGLVFFAINTVLTAWLLPRAGFPRWLTPALAAAALVYLAGSAARILAPQLAAMIAPAYAVPLLAETALMLVLLLRR